MVAKRYSGIPKAANQGNRDAQNNLGVMYDEGDGVAKDQRKANEWYKKLRYKVMAWHKITLQ